mgnify:CR=1 FL=1
MPIKRTVYYKYGGNLPMTLWTEKEVAAKLKITIPKLRQLIEKGGSGIPHHFSESRYKSTARSVKFTHKEYFFNKKCWESICEMAKKKSKQGA